MANTFKTPGITTGEIELFIWETNPKLRNVNNEIKFLINSSLTIAQGDHILTHFKSQQSQYTITEVIDRKKSPYIGKDYVTAKTTWKQL